MFHGYKTGHPDIDAGDAIDDLFAPGRGPGPRYDDLDGSEVAWGASPETVQAQLDTLDSEAPLTRARLVVARSQACCIACDIEFVAGVDGERCWVCDGAALPGARSQYCTHGVSGSPRTRAMTCPACATSSAKPPAPPRR